MATIHRREYTALDGSIKRCAAFSIVLADANGRRVRLAGYTDRRATEELAHKVERLIALHANQQPLDAELRAWLKTLGMKQRRRLAALGLLDAAALGASRPLSEHLNDYRAELERPERENTAQHVLITHNRCKAIIDGIGATKAADLTLARVSAWLKGRRDAECGGLSVKSSNHYVAAIRGFAAWLTARLRLPDNPLAALCPLTLGKKDRKRIRRALEAGEIATLIDTARGGADSYRMSGPQRAALYRVAVETGLRAGELRALSVDSFDLDGTNPTVRVEADEAKNRTAATIPLRLTTAAELRPILAGKLPTARAFPMPLPNDVVKMLRADLDAAGIPYRDDQGRVADFHSLRVSCASHLLASGVDLRTAQEIMRHSTAALTGDVYARTLRRSVRDAIDRLPDFTTPAATARRATGTDASRGAAVSTGAPTGARTGVNAAPGGSRPFRSGRIGSPAACAGNAGFLGTNCARIGPGETGSELSPSRGKQPMMGLEPITPALRKPCSTIELHRRRPRRCRTRRGSEYITHSRRALQGASTRCNTAPRNRPLLAAPQQNRNGHRARARRAALARPPAAAETRGSPCGQIRVRNRMWPDRER